MQTVNTKKVQGRRPIRYESMPDFLADAERLAGCRVKPLGNWSQGQIYEHMAMSLNSCIDGFDFALPAPLRFIMSLAMKNRFLTKGLPPGFKSTGQFIPGEVSVEKGLASLRSAVARQAEDGPRAAHPAFGDIGRDGWEQFNLRHAEMHMSFIVEEVVQ